MSGARTGGGRGFWIWLAVCLLVAAIDLVYHRHVVHAWEAWPGFYSLYGFVACVALVLAARVMRWLLMRPEDYYDAD